MQVAQKINNQKESKIREIYAKCSNFAVHKKYICFYGYKIHFRHGRRRFLVRKGHHFSLNRQTVAGTRLQGHHPEVRPLHQHRPRDAESLRARRVLRDGRRHGDRPGPGTLRALHRHPYHTKQLHHHRPHLQDRHRPRAPRRLPGQDHPGGAPHHGRNQAPHAPSRVFSHLSPLTTHL